MTKDFSMRYIIWLLCKLQRKKVRLWYVLHGLLLSQRYLSFFKIYTYIDEISLHYLLYLYKIQHELKSPEMWINKCPIPCGKLFHVASCNLTVANAYKYVVYVYSKGAFDWQVEYPPWWLTVGSNFCHVSWNQ